LVLVEKLFVGAVSKDVSLHQLLVCLVVVDAELGRKDRGSISHNCDR
ncbi:hypothetical protein L195_g061529, partial [Trifolium pratense]